MSHDIVPPPLPRVNDQGMVETMCTSVTWRGRTFAVMALEAGRADNLGERECFGAPDHGDHGHGVDFEPEKCPRRPGDPDRIVAAGELVTRPRFGDAPKPGRDGRQRIRVAAPGLRSGRPNKNADQTIQKGTNSAATEQPPTLR
jgi:hypothetical protein